MTDLERSARADERSKTIDQLEQALFDVCTGAKLPDTSSERANTGFANFVKLSDALRRALGEEWPNR